jgi:hypothetical protein
MTDANHLTKPTTRSDNSKLAMLAGALGSVILAVLYIKIVGF